MCFLFYPKLFFFFPFASRTPGVFLQCFRSLNGTHLLRKKKKKKIQGKKTEFRQMGSFQNQIGCYKEDQLPLPSVMEVRDGRLGEEI